MKSLSEKQTAKSREIESLLSQRISLEGQLPISKTLEIDKDAFNRLVHNKNGIGLKQVSQLLVVLGLDVVLDDQKVCPSGHSPVSNQTTAFMFTSLCAALGSGPKLVKLEDELVSVGALARTEEGYLLVPGTRCAEVNQ